MVNSAESLPRPIGYRGLSCRVFTTRPAIIAPLAAEKNNTVPNAGESDTLFLRWQEKNRGSKQTCVPLSRVEWVWTNKREPMERGSTL